MVLEGLSQPGSFNTDIVTETGDEAAEVIDALGGDKGHVGGVDSKSLGSPLHLVCLDLQGLDVEGDLDKVVALGNSVQNADAGVDILYQDSVLLLVLEDGARTA